MPTIELDLATYEKLIITARLTEQSVGAVVKRLVDRLANAQSPTTTTPLSDDVVPSEKPPPSWVPVFKVYKGHRLEGEFNPSTMEVKVLTNPWAGRVFSSPTAAATAVVEHFPSTRETSNTNGRRFWRVVSTRRDLRSIVGER